MTLVAGQTGGTVDYYPTRGGVTYDPVLNGGDMVSLTIFHTDGVTPLATSTSFVKVTDGHYRFTVATAISGPGNYPATFVWTASSSGPTVTDTNDTVRVEAFGGSVNGLALATLEDFTVRYEGTVPGGDDDRVNALLLDASGTVQAYIGQVLAQVVDDIINLSGNGQRYVRLPQRPVTDISQVMLNGRVIQDWRWDGYDSIWRPGGWGPYRRFADNGMDDGGDILNDGAFGGYSEAYADTPAIVTVTYTHGYQTIPPIIVKIVCAAARREYINPDGLRQEKIGDYSYRTDGPVDGAAMYLTDSEMSSLDRYRRRRSTVLMR